MFSAAVPGAYMTEIALGNEIRRDFTTILPGNAAKARNELAQVASSHPTRS